MSKQIIVALTGASGHPYALRLLKKLSEAGVNIGLVISEPGCVSLAVETDIKLNANSPDLSKLFGNDPDVLQRVQYFKPRDIAASIASGSNRHDGMVVIPCSMGTLGRIAHCVSDDLIVRAADVTLKERRKLILVTREMPLTLIHLRNMQTAMEAGALVMHACPHFYHKPQTVEEIVDTVVDRVLDHLEIETNTQRWRSGDLGHE